MPLVSLDAECVEHTSPGLFCGRLGQEQSIAHAVIYMNDGSTVLYWYCTPNKPWTVQMLVLDNAPHYMAGLVIFSVIALSFHNQHQQADHEVQ